MRAIWNSYSKSLTARRPRTTTEAPDLLGEVGQQPFEGLDRDPGLGADGGAEHRQPLLHREERLLGGIGGHRDDDPVGQREAPADQVLVARASAGRTSRDTARSGSWTGAAEGEGGVAVPAGLVARRAPGRPDARPREWRRTGAGGRAPPAARPRPWCRAGRRRRCRRRRREPARRSGSRRPGAPCVSAPTPRASMFAAEAASEGGLSSTKSACAAPRESASRPSAPLPAKRSSTRAPAQLAARGCSSRPPAPGRRWDAPGHRAGTTEPPAAEHRRRLIRSGARRLAELARAAAEQRTASPAACCCPFHSLHSSRNAASTGPSPSHGTRSAHWKPMAGSRAAPSSSTPLRWPAPTLFPTRETHAPHAEHRARVAGPARLQVAAESLQLVRSCLAG